MMKDFMAFARALDTFCAGMNRGLAAVAIVLAIIAAGATMARIEQYAPTVMTNVPADVPMSAGQ